MVNWIRVVVFFFENYMKTLKQMLRKHEKPLEQVIKRYQEKNTNKIIGRVLKIQPIATVLNYEHICSPLIQNICGPQYLKLIPHNKININIRSLSDYYIHIYMGEVVQIKNIAHHSSTKEVLIIGF